MECRFDKINNIFQGFGSSVSLRFQKDGGAVGTNLSHWNTGGSSYRCEELLLFFNLYLNVHCSVWDHHLIVVGQFVSPRAMLAGVLNSW